jgi:hypothetical protein
VEFLFFLLYDKKRFNVRESVYMRKLALALLLIFTAFVWACDDGVDERASLGTAYVAASPATDNFTGYLDVVYWRLEDLNNPRTPDNESDDTCSPVIKIPTIPIHFSVSLNPNSNMPLSRVNVIGGKIKHNGSYPLANVPISPISLYDSEFNADTVSVDVTVSLQLFDGDDLSYLATSAAGGATFAYDVSLEFELFELATGIKEKFTVDNVHIQVSDYVNRDEDTCP